MRRRPGVSLVFLLALYFLGAAGRVHADGLPFVDLVPESRHALQNLPWELHWQKYIEPKDFVADRPAPDLILSRPTIWNGLEVRGKKLSSFGYATYRVRFSVPYTQKRLGLRIPAPLTAYRVFINGQQLAEEGKLGNSEQTFVPRRKSALLYFTVPDGEIEIVIQVANFLLYKGGLRTDIELGYASVMQYYGMRYLALDIFCMGLIFSIMVYHFLLFFLSKKQPAILVFALVSFDYFLLAALFGEQSVTLVFPAFPLSVHARLSSAFTYLLPALVVHFTSVLYPGTIAPRLRKVFWLLAVMLLLALVLPTHLFTAYNVLYYGIVGVAAAAVSFFGVYRAMQEKRAGARLMVVGILILLVITAYAVFLFATHSQAGSFLSLGFSLFALFQSASLAHAHAALTHENESMLLSLERSRNALDNQRKQIEANLHDSLGGNLTDIKLGLEALGSELRARSLRKDIRRLDKRVAGTIASLRTELLFLEDMQLATEDFVAGINLILLRRYQIAHRSVDIRITPETRAQSQNLKATGVLTPERIPELCMIVQELCNNSLKYSVGTTSWEIAATGASLCIQVSGKSRYRRSASGLGKETLRERIARIGATFAETATGGGYEASVSLP
ncbi:MAG: hypothetical protein J0L53_10600 [Spirochaetes bacterium]|nr:hypothetical protein [Spirochaetota bacterium]